jgi:hypothetical protein
MPSLVTCLVSSMCFFHADLCVPTIIHVCGHHHVCVWPPPPYVCDHHHVCGHYHVCVRTSLRPCCVPRPVAARVNRRPANGEQTGGSESKSATSEWSADRWPANGSMARPTRRGLAEHARRLGPGRRRSWTRHSASAATCRGRRGTR